MNELKLFIKSNVAPLILAAFILGIDLAMLFTYIYITNTYG